MLGSIMWCCDFVVVWLTRFSVALRGWNLGLGGLVGMDFESGFGGFVGSKFGVWEGQNSGSGRVIF